MQAADKKSARDRDISVNDPTHAEELSDFTDRLRSVSEPARKLLVQIAELAYHGRGQERQPDTAYLPELHESCGLDVDAMYALLRELAKARLIEVEEQYPFEDVRILPAKSGRNALADVARAAEIQKVSLRELLVDLRFDLLT